MSFLEGLIVKGIGGFYYIKTDDGVYECKAKGAFRKMGIKPVAGDRVKISVNENSENRIEEIFQRKNYLVRPGVANIDKLFIVASTCEPFPVPLIIDKLTCLAVNSGIEPVIIITKTDIMGTELENHFSPSPFKVLKTCSVTGEGIEELKNEIKGCVSAFCGNSGVGKSSLINALEPELNLKTSEISRKLGRGKHTTRECELFEICSGLVADTPGFSSFEFEESVIEADDLPFCFPEFSEYLGKCKFSTCSHVNDKGCEITRAVSEGLISSGRHKSYCEMLKEAKQMNSY